MRWMFATFARGALFVALSLALVVGLALGISAIVTATSRARGDLGVTRQRNSSSTQIQENTRLLGDWHTIQADRASILVLSAIKNPTGQDITDLQGAKVICADDVGTFDTDAEGILVSDLPPGVPKPPLEFADYCEVFTP